MIIYCEWINILYILINWIEHLYLLISIACRTTRRYKELIIFEDEKRLLKQH